jgi:hypothetical protein
VNENQDIKVLIDAICELSKVNRLRGLWDHIRFEECKKSYNQIDSALVYKSEKHSRFNVEQRAIQRKIIDRQIKKIFQNE